MRLITISLLEAQALSNTYRIQIIKLLQHETNTIAYVSEKLENKISITTLRHHFDALLKAELIKQTKMVPVKGSFQKYYKSTIVIQEPTK